jgi:hypothetical protein
MVGSASIAFIMPDINPGTWAIRSVAIVVKNLEALPRSPSPFLKKKLAPSWALLANDCAIVRAIVDFPVPAMPFSQNIGLPLLSSAHSVIWRRSSTLVFARHLVLYSSLCESKDAPLAMGSFAKSIFWWSLSVFLSTRLSFRSTLTIRPLYRLFISFCTNIRHT